MKNLLDFMLGSLLFWTVGFGVMFGAGGFVGMPHLFNLNFYHSLLPVEGFLIFQTVFYATAATIVSGAIAERTKFSMYLAYTILISVLIYPVSGHWTWGGCWAAGMGFVVFKGLDIVHGLRVPTRVEEEGLDIYEHGETAYNS